MVTQPWLCFSDTLLSDQGRGKAQGPEGVLGLSVHLQHWLSVLFILDTEAPAGTKQSQRYGCPGESGQTTGPVLAQGVLVPFPWRFLPLG